MDFQFPKFGCYFHIQCKQWEYKPLGLPRVFPVIAGQKEGGITNHETLMLVVVYLLEHLVLNFSKESTLRIRDFLPGLHHKRCSEFSGTTFCVWFLQPSFLKHWVTLMGWDMNRRPGNSSRHQSVQLNPSVMSNGLWPHGLQHARLPCPSPVPGACSNSGSSSQWCHPTISSYVVPFSSCLQFFPPSIFPVNLQGLFPLWLTGLISLQSKELSRDFSSTTNGKHKLFRPSAFMVQLSHPYMATQKSVTLTIWTLVGKVISLPFNMLSRFDIPWRAIPWRRAWQPTSVVLPGDPHRQRSLAGCSPCNRKQLVKTE